MKPWRMAGKANLNYDTWNYKITYDDNTQVIFLILIRRAA